MWKCRKTAVFRDVNECEIRKMNNYEFASTTKIMHALSASLKDEGEAIS